MESAVFRLQARHRRAGGQGSDEAVDGVRREGLPAEERLKGLSQEDLEVLRRLLTNPDKPAN